MREALGRVLEFVNFFRLIPLIAAIVLVPRHFFRNLRACVAGANSVYLTPVSAVTTFASLVVVLAKVVGLPVGYWIVLICLAVLALTGPVWVLLFAFFVRHSKRSNYGSILSAWLWTEDWEDLLLSTSTLRQIDKALYLQGFLYFTIYFVLAALPLILTLTAFIEAKIWLVHTIDPGGDLTDTWNRISALLLFVGGAWIISWAVVRPAGLLFVSCVDVPGEKFYEVEFTRLKGMIEGAFYAEPKDKQEMLGKLRRECRYMLGEFRRQDIRVRNHCSNQLPRLLEARSSAAIELDGLRAVLDENQDADILRAFRRFGVGELAAPGGELKFPDGRRA
jgi:hypothetical protein